MNILASCDLYREMGQTLADTCLLQRIVSDVNIILPTNALLFNI